MAPEGMTPISNPRDFPSRDFPPSNAMRQSDCQVIVTGNEKGGAGKSTVAFHLAVALARLGKRVGALDLDVRQRTFTRYLENRHAWSASTGRPLPGPEIIDMTASVERHLDHAEAEETERFTQALDRFKDACDCVVIDAPGGHTFYSRLAHAAADTLITPMNDSFIDFDLLGKIDAQTYEVLKPSLYAEMVWDCRKRKAMATRKQIDWIVMRNRMSPLEARNKVRVGEAVKQLSRRAGFRVATGLSERVIYRELFPMGLTLLDLTEQGANITLSISHVAARQELRDLLDLLRLPGVGGDALDF